MTIIGLLIIVSGLVFIFGTDIKAIQNDSVRASDFQQVKFQIESYIGSKRKFPESIQELEKTNPYNNYYYDSGSPRKSIYRDPKSNEYYELKYNNDNESYRLCATFETTPGSNSTYRYPGISHIKGYNCIDFDLGAYYSGLLKGTNTPFTTPTPSKPMY